MVEWVAVSTNNQVMRVVGVGFGLIVGGFGIALLAWIYLRIQLDPEDRKPYVVAALSSLATIGVCAAAFAGLTTTLWQQGVITAGAGGVTPALGTVEAYYLWHLVDAVPLLGATQALRWERPVVFTDPWSGGLLLAFKVLLLIPLIRIILSGLRLVQSIWLAWVERHPPTLRGLLHGDGIDRREEQNAGPHPAARRLVVAAQTLGMVVGLIALPLLVYGVLVLVVRRSSLLDLWLTDHIPSQFEFIGVSVTTSWLPIAMDVAGAWLVLAIVWGLADEMMTEYETAVEKYSRRRIALMIFLSCWLLMLATMAAAAVTLTLLHAGLARTDAQLLPSQEVTAALQWYAWHLVDTIPVLDMTQTLNWTIEVEFVDPWSGLLLVLMRVVLIAVLLVPFALFVRLALRYALRRRPEPPQLDAAGRFLRIFRQAQSDLDQAQQQLFAGRTGTRETSGSPLGGASLWLRRSGTGYYPAVYRATRALPKLEHELERVIALFGDGQVIDAGRAAIATLRDRANSITCADRDLLFADGDARRVEVVRQSLEESGLAAVGQRDEYERLAAQMLQTAGTLPLVTSP